jgi:hypothetical protein
MAMRRNLGRGSLALLAGAALTLGCASGRGERSLPPDPLLRSKTPVEATPSNAAPIALARRELPAPDRLPTAIASRRPVQAVPAVRGDAGTEVPAVPASRPEERR